PHSSWGRAGRLSRRRGPATRQAVSGVRRPSRGSRPVNRGVRQQEGIRVAVAVSADEFLAWAAATWIGFDPRCPGANCLNLLPRRESSRYWLIPDHPYSMPHLIESLLGGMDRWEEGYLWPKVGCWPSGADPGLPNERVRDLIWRALGMP